MLIGGSVGTFERGLGWQSRPWGPHGCDCRIFDSSEHNWTIAPRCAPPTSRRSRLPLLSSTRGPSWPRHERAAHDLSVRSRPYGRHGRERTLGGLASRPRRVAAGGAASSPGACFPRIAEWILHAHPMVRSVVSRPGSKNDPSCAQRAGSSSTSSSCSPSAGDCSSAC